MTTVEPFDRTEERELLGAFFATTTFDDEPAGLPPLKPEDDDEPAGTP